MKASVAVAKEADAKKGVSPTKSSDSSIQRLRSEPERQLGSLRDVIGNIRRDGGTPSVDSIATELSSMHTAQRAPVLLALQRTHGNRYVQRVVTGIQAKLVVGQPGDMYEQEADRVADAVMRMPEPEVQRQAEEEEKEEEEIIRTKPLAEQITPLIQRQSEEEEEKILQTKEVSWQSSELTSDFESRIQALKGGGQPLPESARDFFEPRFGYDFRGVRVHTNAHSAKLVRSMNARAFTVGRDVVFEPREYAPDSNAGKRLLAHELTHVVQQTYHPSLAKSSIIIQHDNDNDTGHLTTNVDDTFRGYHAIVPELRDSTFWNVFLQRNKIIAVFFWRPNYPEAARIARHFLNAADYYRFDRDRVKFYHLEYTQQRNPRVQERIGLGNTPVIYLYFTSTGSVPRSRPGEELLEGSFGTQVGPSSSRREVRSEDLITSIERIRVAHGMSRRPSQQVNPPGSGDRSRLLINREQGIGASIRQKMRELWQTSFTECRGRTSQRGRGDAVETGTIVYWNIRQNQIRFGPVRKGTCSQPDRLRMGFDWNMLRQGPRVIGHIIGSIHTHPFDVLTREVGPSEGDIRMASWLPTSPYRIENYIVDEPDVFVFFDNGMHQSVGRRQTLIGA
jgi:hypothetical protein